MYDAILHNDTGVNSKVPLAYLPLKQEDCARAGFMNALISGIFPLLAASSGGYPFVFFSFMMAFQFFVVLFVYPETKGVSLEEMQKRLGIA